MGRRVDGSADHRRLRRSSAFHGAGDGVVAVALPLLAAGLSRDPLALAAVVAAQHVPWVALAVAGPGVIGPADQRTVLGLAATLRAAAAAVIGVLALAGVETMTAVVAGAVVLGLGEALADGAEDVVSGVSGAGPDLYRSGMVGLAAVGLPAGGMLFALAAGVPFVLAMGLFAVAALAALSLPRRLVGRAATSSVAVAPGGGGGPPAGGAAAVTGVATVSSAAGSAVLGVLVLFAVDDLGLGAPAFGLLSCGLAVAASLGAAVAPTVGHVTGLQRGAALALATAGAAYAGAGLVADPGVPYPAVLALASGVAAGMAGSVLLRAALHVAAPPPGAGAAVAAFHVRVWGAVPAGALAGGVVARALGVSAALVAAGAVLVLAAAAAAVTPSGVLEKSG